ncbi:YtxH domain-containing protein [Aquibacillus sediminis]|uniref:YtxH domain-containing protein n=1 Tax=Aquibacillus sediminis TaxID=2574734 RepID=UPI0011081B3C|nr:YtxH domain-containing protein [Aquibacillus sediminis]
MSNRKFVRGVIIGAAVGGLVTLFDRETRNDVVGKLRSTGNATTYYVKHPSTAFHDLTAGYQQLSNQLATGLNSTLQMLAQLQDLLDSIDVEEKKDTPPAKQ